ncbi:MAG: GNAT family N-acetyltransferase [Chloroflexi bacterium]|nr:GNAT family N-acetyltransferase [Chloroflexota bacterium]
MAESRAQPAPGRLWARGEGVSLIAADAPPQDEGVAQAIREGVARSHRGEVVPALPETRLYHVRVAGETVGVLGVAPGPGARTVTFSGVAIAPERRGRSIAQRAVRIAERRLRREGVRAFYGRAPRGNGRGLYFWLRAGYAPLRSLRPEDDASWFRLPTP